jgi:transcriptional regulator with XRE-family HTH domain
VNTNDGDGLKNDALMTPSQRFTKIVQAAMGEYSVYEFAKISGISHTTIRRWLFKETYSPDYASLKKLEKYTNYTAEQLQGIVLGLDSEDEMHTPTYLTAEELMFYANQLSDEQLERFLRMVFDNFLGRVRNKNQSGR